MKQVLMIAFLCGFAFAASAQETESEAQTAPAEQNDKQAGVSDRLCLRQTGSHITAHRNARAENAQDCAPQSGRAYTREDLDSTGAVDIADALRRLDPSVY